MIVAAWATAIATRWAVGKVLNYVRPQPPEIVVHDPFLNPHIVVHFPTLVEVVGGEPWIRHPEAEDVFPF